MKGTVTVAGAQAQLRKEVKTMLPKIKIMLDQKRKHTDIEEMMVKEIARFTKKALLDRMVVVT